MLNKLRILAVFILILLSVIILSTLHSQPSQWSSRGIGGGGALFSPSFNPNNSNEIYLACDMSELFRSTNLGTSWETISFMKIQGGNNSRVQYISSSPQTMYCINHTGDASTPCKSTDGGNTWVNLQSDPTSGEAYSFYTDINNPNNLIVTDYSRLWFSNNGGTSFSLKYTSQSGGGCLVAGVFFDSTRIFVGTNKGLLVSTNSGSSFSLNTLTGIPAANGLLSFTGAKQNGITRFFAVTADTNYLYAGIPGSDYWDISQGIYSMDYGQSNWTLKMTGVSQGVDFPFFVSMARNNINIVYTGGSNDNGFPSVFKSTNAGASWQQTFLTNNNQNIVTGWSGTGGDRGWGYGECAMGFTVNPLDPSKIAISDYGFIHISSNSGATWQQGYVTQATQNPMNTSITAGKPYQGNGLENTSCWWLTWADPNNMFACYSDIRGLRSTNGGSHWAFNYTGQYINTSYYTLKHSNGMMYCGTGNMHDMYQSTFLQDNRIDCGVGYLLMSSNNGAAWTTMHNFSYMVIWMSLDPTNPNRMYASVIHSTQGGIFVSNDIQNGAASTWTRCALPPRTEGHPFNVKVLNDGTVVCTYSGRRNPQGAFTPSSGVFVSTNQGTTWMDRSHTGMYYWTKDVVVYPHDPAQNTWYAGVFSGWGGAPNGLGGLYRTTNRGVNWTRINNTDRVTSCTFSPTDPNICFMTTEVNGLLYSNNIASANPTFTPLASYTFRQPERVFYNPYNSNEIWVTSFGHGLAVGSTLIGINGNSTEIPEKFMLHQNYPNPFNPQTNITLDLPKTSDLKLVVYDILGREIEVLQNGVMNAGIHTIKFNAADLPSGIYFCRAEYEGLSEVIKLSLLK